jgi:purine-binding chemotaxis protein CheW
MSDREGTGVTAFDLWDATEEAPGEVRRCILFQACDEWFGLPIEWVREIQPLERITRVPNAPADLLGIMNLRGRVLALYDLAGSLGIPRGTQPNTHVVVLDFADPEVNVGLVAQRIAQVREIPVSAIEPPPPREGGAAGLEGICDLDGQVVGLLDLARLFGRYLAEWGVVLEARGAA